MKRYELDHCFNLLAALVGGFSTLLLASLSMRITEVLVQLHYRVVELEQS